MALEDLREYERLYARAHDPRSRASSRKVAMRYLQTYRRIHLAVLKAQTERGEPLTVHRAWESAQMVGAAATARASGQSAYRVRQLVAGHDRDDCPECGPRNPQAPHRVYLFHFPALRAFKVGVTHLRNDNRLRAHVRNGGELVETVTVDTFAQALALERAVLAGTSHRRLVYGAAEFPAGGGTECWSDDLPVTLQDFIVG